MAVGHMPLQISHERLGNSKFSRSSGPDFRLGTNLSYLGLVATWTHGNILLVHYDSAWLAFIFSPTRMWLQKQPRRDNLRATGWDESSIMDRSGETGCEKTDHIQPEEHAARPSLPIKGTATLPRKPLLYLQDPPSSREAAKTSQNWHPLTPRPPPQSQAHSVRY